MATVELVSRRLDTIYASLYRYSGSLFTSTLCGKRPVSINHVGVIVYGNLYEFGPTGVHITDQSSVGHEFKIYCLGGTSKSKTEVQDWVSRMSKTDFAPETYKTSIYNCIIFAIAFCNFLGVEPIPDDFIKLKDWCRKNKGIIDELQLKTIG